MHDVAGEIACAKGCAETISANVLKNSHKQIEKRKKYWRIRVSIPVLPACEAGALPFELIPQMYVCLSHCEAVFKKRFTKSREMLTKMKN